MDADVRIGMLTTHVNAFDAAGAMNPETLRQLAGVLAPLLRELLAHDAQVKNEGSMRNGALDRIERGGP
jgi:hypothetical protein